MIMDDSWRSLFVDGGVSPFSGYVLSIESADELIQEYSYRTCSAFVYTRGTKDVGHFSLTGLCSVAIYVQSSLVCLSPIKYSFS